MSSSRWRSRQRDLERVRERRELRLAQLSGQLPVHEWSTADKVEDAIRRSLPLLPARVAIQLESILTPEGISVMATVVAIWGGSHFVGVGEAADLVLLLAGVAALGVGAIQGGESLFYFARCAYFAKAPGDLDEAAGHLAQAIAVLGIEAVILILLRKRPRPLPNPGALIPPTPVRNSRFFYRPQTLRTPKLEAGTGRTTAWGDIVVSSRGSSVTQRMAELHEQVHSFLTPKLYFLRNLRVRLAAGGYAKSELLCYLEEALAETIARAQLSGWIRGISIGVRFPVRNGYVTVASLSEEAIGILLGPVTISGVVFRVFFEPLR